MREKETAKLYHSITNIDSQFADEAVNYKKSAQKPVWARWGALAACFAAAALIGALWSLSGPAAPRQSAVVYFLSETGAMESKRVTVHSDPKDIFDKWAAANNVSDVLLVDCVYDTQGAAPQDGGGEGPVLSLTVSSGFSRYMENENGAFLIETLRRTFYDGSSFDHMDLIVESLTDSAVSSGIAQPGMETEDGRAFVWEEMSEREIDGTGCCSFELRFSDDEEKNGEMAGRLWGIYAVSKDGTRFYQYNMADDTWEQLTQRLARRK